MTTLLEQVLDYLLRWSAWLAALTGIAAAAGVIGWLPVRSGVDLRRAIGSAVLGALVVASLAHRLGIPGPEIAVWRHDLPWLWTVIGAVLGVTALSIFDRRATAPNAVAPGS